MRRHRTPLTPRRTPMSPQMRRTLSALPTSGYALIVDGHIRASLNRKRRSRGRQGNLRAAFPCFRLKSMMRKQNTTKKLL